VKGILIHDNVMVLQRIINDHLWGEKERQKQMTTELTKLANCLKVIYKKHVPMKTTKGCDAHGVLNGLSASVQPQEECQCHYSMMEDSNQLREIASIRGIQDIHKKTRAKLIQELDHLDHLDLTNQPDALLAIPCETSAFQDRESLDNLLEQIDTGQKMTKARLFEIASSHGISLKITKKNSTKKALKLALIAGFERVQRDKECGMCQYSLFL
jgi:hypothetical protein